MRENFKCAICKDSFYGYGNNPLPVAEGRCCDYCDSSVVIPTRIANYMKMRI